MTESPKCPFKIEDKVKFTPSKRTMGLYPNIETRGLIPDHIYKISEIRDGIYLYFEEGGGWPWNEFEVAEKS